MRLFRALSRWWKNFKGASRGYESCRCCGDSFEWKPARDTFITDQSVPIRVLCNQCWEEKSVEERLPYYKHRYDQLQRDNKDRLLSCNCSECVDWVLEDTSVIMEEWKAVREEVERGG